MQTIYAGAGDQDVEVYAEDAQGRLVAPSSATAKIVDLCEPDTAEDAVRIVAATTAAVVDPTATTTTVTAGPREENARRVTVVSAVGFVVGRRYGLTGTAVESFVLDRVDGLDLYARDVLRYDFDTGAGVVGLRVSATFPAARADDVAELARRAPFGVDWIFVGVTGEEQVRTLARIERRGRALRATTHDMTQIDPQLSTVTHARTTNESHLKQADLEVSAHLLHRGTPLADTQDGEVGRLAVAWRAVQLAYQALGSDHEDRMIAARVEAKMWLKMLIGGAQPDDAVETTRPTDHKRPRRRRIGVAL